MFKKKYLLIICSIITLFLTGCGQEEVDEDPFVVAQNDWAGGFNRLAKVQSDVMEKLSILDSHNYEIIMGNPENYWANEDFRYLHLVPVNSEFLPYTSYFNEIEDFSVIQQNITNAFSESGYELVDVQKIDVNHYLLNIAYKDLSWRTFEKVYKQKEIECIYDASHDWLQMSTNVSENFSENKVEEDLYEFAQLTENTYIIQNENERLYAVYENGILKEFYYSILPDVTKSIAADYYAEDNEKDMEEIYAGIMSAGETITAIGEEENPEEDIENIGLHYSKQDNSIFKHLDKCTPEWVTAAENLKGNISYVNGTLSVSVKNKLTEEMESFAIKEIIKENTDETVQESSAE